MYVCKAGAAPQRRSGTESPQFTARVGERRGKDVRYRTMASRSIVFCTTSLSTELKTDMVVQSKKKDNL